MRRKTNDGPETARRDGNRRGPLGFRIIGALKLTSGLLLFVAWAGMFRLFRSDLTRDVEWLVRHFHLDAESRVVHLVLVRVAGINRKTLHAIEAGTFFYALLHVVEGTGLFLEREWAGYLTVVATSALVPFELYEIIRKPNPLKLGVLVINLGFVAYLVIKLRQEQRERRGEGAGVAECGQSLREGL
jgi:uncharacterized membrane protein (DUF2068 family)